LLTVRKIPTPLSQDLRILKFTPKKNAAGKRYPKYSKTEEKGPLKPAWGSVYQLIYYK